MDTIISSFSGFSVIDLQTSKAFYSDVLGLNLASEKMGLRYELPGGGSVFMYEKKDHTPATFTVLNLVVSSIDTAVDTLGKKGVTFEQYPEIPHQDEKGIARGITNHMGPDIAWFKDPSGNILSVLQDA